VWVPTPDELVEKMLNLGNVTASDYLIDLGSGDGRTVIMAAKRGARAHGIEYNPEMVELSKRSAAAAGVSERATFAKEDLFESDFSKASVITMFLLPQINLKLRPKILDLKPGTRIVSNSFTMGEWREDGSDSLDAECINWCTALLWIVPAKAGGTWKLALRDKGNPFGAGLWEGLTLFFEREPYIFKDRETGKDVERSRLVVGKVVDGLGSGASSAPAAQPTAEPAPSSPTAESASSNGDGELTPALRLALTKAAKAADSYNAFVEAAFAVPGVVDNAAAEQVVLDEGFYAQARA
jgi:SAM-dependent methyltransferase